MKVYLDTQEPADNSWTHCEMVDDAIALLQTGRVTELSIASDLGKRRRKGIEVLFWIENQVFSYGFDPPQITIHSASPQDRVEMVHNLKVIRRMSGGNGGGSSKSSGEPEETAGRL